MVLRLTQPITEMSTKGDRCLGLTTLPLSCADCHKIWEPQPLGNLRACPGLYRDCFTSFYHPTEGMIGFLRLNAMLHSVLQLLDTATSHSHKIKTASNKPISYRSNTHFSELLGYKTKNPHELIQTYGKTETVQ
jgi:hypothetical protein